MASRLSRKVPEVVGQPRMRTSDLGAARCGKRLRPDGNTEALVAPHLPLRAIHQPLVGILPTFRAGPDDRVRFDLPQWT